MVETFLEGILLSIGKMINHYTSFPAKQEQTNLNCSISSHHSIFTEILRILLNRFPSLIIYILKYKVPEKLIETYFKSSFPTFYELLNVIKHESSKDLGFIDFLWVANPFIEQITQSFFIFLTKFKNKL